MPSSYTDSLRIEKQAKGENENIWGDITNTNFELFEDAISGVQDVTVSSANVTLTSNDGSSDQARHAVLNLQGAVTSAIDVIFPDAEKTYLVRAGHTGNTVVLKNTTGTGVSVAAGRDAVIFCDGSETYKIIEDFSDDALLKEDNLSGLVNVSAARGNLGLGSLAVKSTVETGDLDSGVSEALAPSGVLMPYAGTSTPAGWLLCYGQAVSRTTYSDLFTAIGTTYGAGDGSTTFNLPDLRGRVIAGLDNMGGTSANRLTDQPGGLNGDTLGDTGGSETHTLTESEMPEHDHFIMNSDGPTQAPSVNATTHLTRSNETFGNATYSLRGSDTEPNVSPSELVGGSEAHNNVQPTIVLNYIIKT